MTSPTIDATKVEEFLGKVLTDTSGLTVTVLASIGDRLGLWKDLATNGAATSAELATRTGIHPRYAKEWADGMTAAGYLVYDSGTERFTLPAEHVPVVADEGGAAFFGGMHQMLHGMVNAYDHLLDAFRSGGGVPMSAYHDDTWDGMERFTGGWFNNLLVPEWMPLLPDVETKLQAGSRVADVGCGRGRALTALAEAYPASTFVGYDAFEPSIERARANAEASGVADRVTFEACDGSKGLPETFDVIFTFDVVHDAVDPRGLLRSVREALDPDGVYVCLDINASHRPEENAGPLGALFYGVSVLYCMTTSLAGGGEGLGTCGFNPQVAEQYCKDAGFGAFRRVEMENPFNCLYEARP